MNEENQIFNENVEENNAPKKKLDFETFLGKNLMAIGASILIFIALIMFASVISEKLTDIIKMVAMYIFSFTFIILGEVFSRKKKSNKAWSTVLLGLGVGSLMVSLFVSFGYFKAFNIYVLYGLLTLVIVYVRFLGGKKSFIFSVIGQIGIIVAIIFSIPLIREEQNFIVAIILLLLSQLPFIVIDLVNKNFYNFAITCVGANIGFFLCNIINYAAYRSASNHVVRCYTTNIDFIGLAIGLVLTLYVTYISRVFAKTSKERHAHGLLAIANTLNIGVAIIPCIRNIDNALDFRNYAWVISLVLFVFTIIYLDGIKGLNKPFVYGFNSWLALMILQLALINNDSVAAIAVPVIALIFVICGMIKQKIFFTYLAFALVLHPLMHWGDSEPFRIAEILLMIAVFALDVIVRVIRKNQQAVVVNVILYCLSYLAAIDVFVSLKHIDGIGADAKYLIMTVVLLAIQSFALIVRHGEEDKSLTLKIMYYFGHGISIFFAMFVVFVLDGPIAFTVGALVLLILCSLNNHALRELFEGFAFVYMAIKYTVVVCWILSCATISGFIFSVIFLIFAIIAIVMGFVFKDKFLRIYGLVLSMISVIKLVLYDVKYDDTAVRALGFLICGILCFIISYIYHRVDSKTVKVQKEIGDEYTGE